MSRSYKKAIIKDNGSKDIYWKTIRRVVKNTIKKFYNAKYYQINRELNYSEPDVFGWDDDFKNEKELEDMIKQPKEMIDDYNYSDYTIDMENDEYYKDRRDKYRRK